MCDTVFLIQSQICYDFFYSWCDIKKKNKKPTQTTKTVLPVFSDGKNVMEKLIIKRTAEHC